MEIVSDAWKELHKQTLLPETFLEITIHAMNMRTDKASVESDNEASFSHTDNILNNVSEIDHMKYATLELNAWSLDGSIPVLENLGENEQAGFVSNVMGTTEYIGCEESFWIRFPEPSTSPIPGITVTWSTEYEEYPHCCAVNFYLNGEHITGTEYIKVNGFVTEISCPCDEYDTIQIMVLGWSVPYHRVRIENVLVGHNIVFDKTQIVEYSHEQSGDLNSFALPKNEITFSLNNTDGRWDILNPNGDRKYLFGRQPITVRYGMDVNGEIEWIRGGRFFLTEWKVPSSGIIANFVARDALAFLLNQECDYTGKMMYTRADTKFYENRSFSSQQITENLPPPGTPYGIQEKYNDGTYDWYRTEIGWTPIQDEGISTPSYELFCRDLISRCDPMSLMQIVFPYNWDYHMGIIYYYVPQMEGRDTPANLIQMMANSTSLKLYSTRDGTFVVGGLSLELSDYVISKNIAYSHPEVQLSAPIKRVEIVVHDSDGDYNRVTPVGNEGEILVVNNPYIRKGITGINAESAYKEVFKHQETITGEFRADPRLDVFDFIQVETKHGMITPVVITQLKYTYNGCFRATYTGRRYSEDAIT